MQGNWQFRYSSISLEFFDPLLSFMFRTLVLNSLSSFESVKRPIIWVIFQNYLYDWVRGVQHRWVLEGLCLDASRGCNIVLSAFSWNKSDEEEEALPRLASAEDTGPITGISVGAWRWCSVVCPVLSDSLTGNRFPQGLEATSPHPSPFLERKNCCVRLRHPINIREKSLATLGPENFNPVAT